MRIRDKDVLLVIDVQRDFCAGGELAIPDGDAVVAPINRLGGLFRHVVLTQDWHPEGHLSFASSHAGAEVYASVQMPYGAQTLWPDHCVQGTEGAAFHPLLAPPHVELAVRKGFRREIDSYSAFLENDKKTPTGLAGYLRERGFERIFVAGLAYDYCVRFSVVDGKKLGFESFVIEDACRAVGLPGTVEAAEREFAAVGVERITAADIESADQG
jgi:nicotinamidase/pyrazinamidase